MPLAAHELEHVRVEVPPKYISWSLSMVTELESSEASVFKTYIAFPCERIGDREWCCETQRWQAGVRRAANVCGRGLALVYLPSYSP